MMNAPGRPKLPDGEKAFLLNGSLGWRGAVYKTDPPRQIEPPGIAVGEYLRLAADPEGPLALESADGSLGRLILPRGLAFADDWTLYMLVSHQHKRAGVTIAEHTILRFDPERQGFVALPDVGGSVKLNDNSLPDARQFRAPSQIAIAGQNLYVTDPGAGRVQVFDRASLALRYVWGPWLSPRQETTEPPLVAWQPVDVTATPDHAFILDQANARVYRHQPGIDRLVPVIDIAERRGDWTRIAIDRDNNLYLYNQSLKCLEIFGQRAQTRWAYRGSADDAGDVRDQFDSPAIIVDHKARFCLPESLRRIVGREFPDSSRNRSGTRDACAPPQPGCLYFERRSGEPVEVRPDEVVGPALYARFGHWMSTALNSEIYRCQWHRLLVDVSRLPAGSTVTVWTLSSAELLDDYELSALPEEMWQRCLIVSGSTQADDAAAAQQAVDALIQSREGQYLWLRVGLTGDGFDSPEISATRAYYPRDSYLKYLPAVFSQDEDSRWFLERFLSIAQTEWEALERSVRASARYFDPKAVPVGAAMRYLASWFALPLEGEWDGEQNRRLLMALPHIMYQRGTIKGLQAYLRAYLANISQVDEDWQADINMPVILEGFRERNYLLVNAATEASAADELLANASQLDDIESLWSNSAVNRLQLDVNAVEGEARLISTPNPELDQFSVFAHRFHVYVPAAWVRSADNERMLRRAIDSEKPAHTDYTLHLVEARFRVGVQARLGVDAVIGALPAPQPLMGESGPDSDAPPSQAPHGRLGYDIVLGQGDMHRKPKTPRVGLDTQLS